MRFRTLGMIIVWCPFSSSDDEDEEDEEEDEEEDDIVGRGIDEDGKGDKASAYSTRSWRGHRGQNHFPRGGASNGGSKQSRCHPEVRSYEIRRIELGHAYRDHINHRTGFVPI